MNKIISEIEEYLEADFEKKLFKASVKYLENKDDLLRLNSFCYSLRELFRHVFLRLAPDNSVKKCSWYAKETDNNQPTRKQRFLFSVQGGLTPEFVLNDLQIDVAEYWRDIRDSINTLSKYTHVGENTFDISGSVVDSIAEEALSSLLSIFHITHDTRVDLHSSLTNHIDKALIKTLLLKSFSEIDTLSSYSYIESCEVNDWTLSDIDEDTLAFDGEATVYVSLNYGKGEDHCELNEEFPFTFSGYSKTDKPYDLSIPFDEIDIDTESW
ncbi:hypothetical protein [uncultured Cocleimonas sp.]|uniref:pPIWI-associating nuclease domain-containing protein n=1 Tax=uncultured Cocleimonas sp. TaxID=1051587 RepID=UPI0026387049|nr:hypothetical protein [uncultured Cocleimonas sp.]